MFAALATIPTLAPAITCTDDSPGLNLVVVPHGCGRGTAARAHALHAARLQDSADTPAPVLYLTDDPVQDAIAKMLRTQRDQTARALTVAGITSVADIAAACDEVRPITVVLDITRPYDLFTGPDTREEVRSLTRSMVSGGTHVTMYVPTRRVSDEARYYQEGDDPAPFTVRDATGAPLWEPRPGDLRVPTLREVLANPVLLTYADTVTSLHRAMVVGNREVTDEHGVTRLSDSRACAQVLKARTAVASPTIPLRFDIPAPWRRATYLPA